MQNNFSPLFRKEGDSIVCLLCRHYCKLKDGQVGFCGVNKNSGGALENLVYQRVSSLNIDPIEKKPLYHFLPSSKTLSLGTVGCNFKCHFCQNWQISQSKNIRESYSISVEEIVQNTIRYNTSSIAYTYNEPTIFWPFAKDIASLAKEYGIKGVFVSNGFESSEVIDDMEGLIDGFNIDIKSFSSNYYKKTLKGDLNGVLDTLKRLKQKGVWVECTTLIIPDENDSDEELREIASFISKELSPTTPWHISAFHPDYKIRDRSSTPLSTLIRAYEIGKEEGLEYIYLGNIAMKSATKCPNCQSDLIVREGFFVLKNTLKDGKCPKCQREIEGVWK